MLSIDEETLFQISEGFGAGMGGMMETCGAVTAMFMALGLKNSSGDLQACDTKPQTMRLVRELAAKFKAVYKEAMNGEDFPQDPTEQLMGAVKAVFRSWDNPRANVYRRDNDIPYSWVLPSTCSPWPSATWAMTAAPAWPLPAAPPPARRSSSASF